VYTAQETTTTTTASESFWTKGGPMPSKTFNNDEKYDAGYTKWIYELHMPTARHELGGVSNEGRIYVIGEGHN
jgi:hypothetical protein